MKQLRQLTTLHRSSEIQLIYKYADYFYSIHDEWSLPMRSLKTIFLASLMAVAVMSHAGMASAEDGIEKDIRNDVRDLDKDADRDGKDIDKEAKKLDKERHKEDKHLDKEEKKHL